MCFAFSNGEKLIFEMVLWLVEDLCPQSLILEHLPFAASEILQDQLHADGRAEFQQLLWQSRGSTEPVTEPGFVYVLVVVAF